MSGEFISSDLRETVRRRAGILCEYCRFPEVMTLYPHEPDHIIALQHQGKTFADNLALALVKCNRLKGPNLASIDSVTGAIVRLFNPRTDRWTDHFRSEGSNIVPLTPIGRSTAALLRFADPERIEARRFLIH